MLQVIRGLSELFYQSILKGRLISLCKESKGCVWIGQNFLEVIFNHHCFVFA
jgi:hypothetical protein